MKNKLDKSYIEQDGCHNCKHVYVDSKYDHEEYLCCVDQSGKPINPCIDARLNPENANKLWDDWHAWAEPRKVQPWGNCKKWGKIHKIEANIKDYSIILEYLKEDNCWMAYLPAFGRSACSYMDDTPEEALVGLDMVYQDVHRHFQETGKEIPKEERTCLETTPTQPEKTCGNCIHFPLIERFMDGSALCYRRVDQIYPHDPACKFWETDSPESEPKPKTTPQPEKNCRNCKYLPMIILEKDTQLRFCEKASRLIINENADCAFWETPPAIQQKPQWSLIPWQALEQVVLAFQSGLSKYPRNDWKRRVNEKDGRDYYSDKIMRHFVTYLAGQTDESGLNPLAHLIADALILLWKEQER